MIKSYEMVIQPESEEEKSTELSIKYAEYALGRRKEITEESLKRILKKIRKGEKQGLYLFDDPEGSYMQIEIDKGLILLQYVESPGTQEESSYSLFNPSYLESEEESPMRCSDGQSIVLMRYTVTDTELVAKCVEYFVRSGKLYPETAWLKGWQVRE